MNPGITLHTLRAAMMVIGCIAQIAQPVLAAQSFVLSEPGGKPLEVNTGDFQATVIVFVSALCPISTDYGTRLTSLNKKYSGGGVRMLLVNSNQNEPDSQVQAQRNISRLPAVYRDRRGKLAETLEVTATPTAVVLDRSGSIRYWGAIDDSRNPARVRQEYLRLAIEEVLAGKQVTLTRTPVRGCSIKGSNN